MINQATGTTAMTLYIHAMESQAKKDKERIEELEQANSECCHHYESALRSMQDQIDALLADIERLRDALEHLIKGALSLPRFAGQEAEEALAATPAQSLDSLLDPYRAHIERLREAVEEGLSTYKVPMTARICEALAATPAQSLARLRNQVREVCATICQDAIGDDDIEFPAMTCARRIRATKEQE